MRISTVNPTSSLPFFDSFPTGSEAFDSWYTTVSSSAVEYDEDNIHSLVDILDTGGLGGRSPLPL